MTFLPDRITERDELPDELDKDFGRTTGRARASTDALGISAASFARAMSKAFADASVGGKKFDDVLRQLALRLSGMTVAQAFQPLARNLAGGLGDLFGGVFGEDKGTHGRQGCAADAIGLMDRFVGLTPFAAGGVISTPAYFPLGPSGLGVAGEAGPEAILPLARGRDGRLGVAMSGAHAAANVTVHIATPDADSFRRSEAYITGQIARAVARGQRSF
ncbi:MAG TPA: phage tail tape measure protein [Pseudolabrys sp.]|nr:phage tail tape measure protein [Pseudolabrys sp.]